jgi:DNA-binding CsgD family transcriptional regulator
VSFAGLTRRERQVAAALATGATCAEIAAVLAISAKTIDTHRGHVLKKLGLRNVAELTLYAVRHGPVSMFDGGESAS